MTASVLPTLGQLTSEMEPTALEGLQGAQREVGQELLQELMKDWQREAGDDSDTPVVYRILREDYAQLIDGLGPEERLTALRGQVLERRVRAVGVRGWELGTRTVDGALPDDVAHAQGERLLEDVDALLPSLRALPDRALGARLERDLEEARLEALYAIERKAMSPRLQRYLEDQRGAPTPPQIIP